jgi:hypothetical protein
MCKDYLLSMVTHEKGFVVPLDLPGLGIEIIDKIFKDAEAISKLFS